MRAAVYSFILCCVRAGKEEKAGVLPARSRAGAASILCATLAADGRAEYALSNGNCKFYHFICQCRGLFIPGPVNSRWGNDAAAIGGNVVALDARREASIYALQFHFFFSSTTAIFLVQNKRPWRAKMMQFVSLLMGSSASVPLSWRVTVIVVRRNITGGGRAEGAVQHWISGNGDEFGGLCEGNGVSVVHGTAWKRGVGGRCNGNRIHEYHRLFGAVWVGVRDGSNLRASLRLQELVSHGAGVAADDTDAVVGVRAYKPALDKFQDHNAAARTGFEHHGGGECVLHVCIARPSSKQHPAAPESVSSISGYHDADDVVLPVSRGVPRAAERGSGVCDGNGSAGRGHSNLVDQFQHGVLIAGVFGVHGSLQEDLGGVVGGVLAGMVAASDSGRSELLRGVLGVVVVRNHDSAGGIPSNAGGDGGNRRHCDPDDIAHVHGADGVGVVGVHSGGEGAGSEPAGQSQDGFLGGTRLRPFDCVDKPQLDNVPELGNCPQTTGCGVLRGSARPAVGARINLGSFYFVGTPVALVLAFVFKLGLVGLCYGLLAAQIACASSILVAVLRTDWVSEAVRAQQLTGMEAELEMGRLEENQGLLEH
eukprot:Gb_04757 [translate_table: standard]